MDLNFQSHIPADFPDNARVWIYQCSRRLSIAEALTVEEDIHRFVNEWHTHGAANRSFANLFFGQFLVLMADETMQPVSGCSTDSSVRFVKQLEQQFSVNFFDRQTLAFVIKGQLQLLPLAQLDYAVKHHFVNAGTLYFNNLVSTKKALLENWITPAGNTWLAPRLGQPAS